MSDKKPSKYQLEIFKEYKETNNNIFVKAGPGSGKTHTLLELLKITPFYKKVIFTAFNKSIADELKTKVRQGVDVSTIHSLAYRILRQNKNNRFKLNEIKTYILAKKITPVYYKDQKKQSIYLFTIGKLYDLYRMNLAEKTQESLQQLADMYSVDLDDNHIEDTIKAIDYIEKYNKGDFSKKEMMIDFTDMLWLTYKDVDISNYPKYDVVLIDETQDLNPLQRETILKLINKSGRFVAVGDEFQSIYSFMGSNLESFTKLQNMPNTTVLPLSVSYRCGSNIIKKANEVFEGLEPFEGNGEGIVRNGHISEIRDGDFLICRNNLPLIESFLDLLDLNKKSHILGKDFGKSLTTLIDKIDDVKELDEMLIKKIEKLKERGIQSPTNHKSYIDLLEKSSIIKTLYTQKEYDLYEMKELFKELFIENFDKKGITLTTVHKSKGLEADRVFWLQPQLIPSQYARTELELYQEKCLKYVVITRAKNELIIIN